MRNLLLPPLRLKLVSHDMCFLVRRVHWFYAVLTAEGADVQPVRAREGPPLVRRATRSVQRAHDPRGGRAGRCARRICARRCHSR